MAGLVGRSEVQADDPILKINNIEVKYHEVILVLKGVSIEVPRVGSWLCWGPTAPARAPPSRPSPAC